jgi:DNA-binding protein H-NS
MRKPRDFDSELRALNDKAKQLRARKVDQLGELVIACGTDALPIEQLAGALLAASEADAKTKEGWRQRGAAFFRKGSGDAGGDDRNAGEPAPGGDRA